MVRHERRGGGAGVRELTPQDCKMTKIKVVRGNAEAGSWYTRYLGRSVCVGRGCGGRWSLRAKRRKKRRCVDDVDGNKR